MTALLNLIVLVGMCYVVPAGLRLIDPVFGRWSWTAAWYAGAGRRTCPTRR